jgi:NADH dehydrogenase
MAVAEVAGMHFWGLPAWLTWLFVHLMYIAEFENRVLVLVQWGWNYITRNRSARLITQNHTDFDSDRASREKEDDWSTGW